MSNGQRALGRKRFPTPALNEQHPTCRGSSQAVLLPQGVALLVPRGRRGLGGRGGRSPGRVGASVGGAGRGGQVGPFLPAQEPSSIEPASPAELPFVTVILGRPLLGFQGSVGCSVRFRPTIGLSRASCFGSRSLALGPSTVPRRPLHLRLDGARGGVFRHRALQASVQVEGLEVAVAVEALGPPRPGQQRALPVRPHGAIRGCLVGGLLVLQLEAGTGLEITGQELNHSVRT